MLAKQAKLKNKKHKTKKTPSISDINDKAHFLFQLHVLSCQWIMYNQHFKKNCIFLFLKI